MTDAEHKQSKREWQKLIRKWKMEELDRTQWKRSALDNEDDAAFCMMDRSIDERLENLMNFAG